MGIEESGTLGGMSNPMWLDDSDLRQMASGGRFMASRMHVRGRGACARCRDFIFEA